MSRPQFSLKMEENPYRSPTEVVEPPTVEPEDWATRLRRWAIGPVLPVPWMFVVATIVAAVSALALFRHLAR